ncbi:MAG TPA: transcriptional repressor LexA [Candidatus Hydrogenedentes bacterium]|nr:transcriptional repressor LexA [Candidatus Hydrogenedentota bacterium]
MAKGLTRRQEEILAFIIESIRDRGCPPTIAEIGGAFGISSTNGVNDHLNALRKKGYITRTSKARGIHVTEKAAAGLYRQPPGTLPLVGRVAAGLPVFAEEHVEDHVTVDPELAACKGFCLRVQGDSMIEKGILDGDVLVVDRQREAKRGDVVVALVGDEVTVKQFYPHGERVELRPANQAMQTMVFPADSVAVQGVVVALQRKLV